MTLTLVPAVGVAREWRGGVWVKISISLIVPGVAALVTAVILGMDWYYGLHSLSSDGVGRSASVSMTAGTSHVIDEWVSVAPGHRNPINVRGVSVRVSGDVVGATIVGADLPRRGCHARRGRHPRQRHLRVAGAVPAGPDQPGQ